MSDPAETGSRSLATLRIWLIELAVLAVLAALVGLQPSWSARLQLAWFDAYQTLAPREVVTTPAMVVEIDEKSIAQLGQWPWTVLAQLLRDIEKFDPLAIGIDIQMSEADRMSPQLRWKRAADADPILAARLAALPSNDAELALAIRAGSVVLSLAGTPDPTGKTLRAPPFTIFDPAQRAAALDIPRHLNRFGGVLPSIDELDRAAVGHGLISVRDPARSVIRRIPLVSDVAGTLVPALSVEMLRVALHVRGLRLQVSGQSVRGVSIGNFTAPTEDDGSLRIYYSPRDPRRFVSAIDVLRGNVDPESLRDKLVLVGVTGVALTDYQNTPLGEAMPGSEIHAQLLENLKDQTWLRRPSWAVWVEIAVFVLLGLALIRATPRWKPPMQHCWRSPACWQWPPPRLGPFVRSGSCSTRRRPA